MPTFNHLHCHTQFSLLDGTTPISVMVKNYKEDNMRGVAMTDHGNMLGHFSLLIKRIMQE